ncbi:MAG: tetratricopeptide repeat protein [Candidatus Thermoplasmatota archaeon]
MELLSSLEWYVGRAATEAPFGGVTATARPTRLMDARRALAEGKHEEALAAFERSIRDGKDGGLAHLGRALCLLHLGREDEAGLAIEEAGDDAGVAEVPLRLARICAVAGRPTDALRLVAVVLQAAPEMAPMVANDKRLTSLRDHPMFLQMVGQL